MRATNLPFVLVALCSSTVWAGPGPGGQDADEAARTKYKGTTVYDFEDDNVDGELLSPEGANINARGKSKHASLISIRPHFIPELIKMANDV